MANEFSLEEFSANFGNSGGARAYLFAYAPELAGSGYNGNVTYTARATSLPESNIEEIPIHWQGMANKLTGARTYADWTVTLNCDNAWGLREHFESWMNLINNYDGGGSFASKRSDYVKTQTLWLLDYSLVIKKEVKLMYAWPKSVGAITLDYSSQDVAQFDVTFAYNYFTLGEYLPPTPNE